MRTRYTTIPLCAALLLTTSMDVRAQVCPSTASLSTPYDSDNGLAGIMFDVTTLQNVVINCFEMNFDAGTVDPIIYHKTDTHVGFETVPGAWTAIDSVDNIVSAGIDQPTYLPIDVNVPMTAGSTHAFYISNRTGSNAKYTNGTLLGGVFANDANLQIKQGTGVGYPFGFNINPRKFNGGIYYTIGTAGLPETSTTDAITLAPNPAEDHIRIGGARGTTISITDALGRPVLNTRWTSDVDVSSLAPGSYVLSVMDSSGSPVGTCVFLKR